MLCSSWVTTTNVIPSPRDSPRIVSSSPADVIGSTANDPITYETWGDAARFANWLSNNQPTGPEGASTTETGSYTLNGATTAAVAGCATPASAAQHPRLLLDGPTLTDLRDEDSRLWAGTIRMIEDICREPLGEA